MSRQTGMGRCSLCGNSFSRALMTRHLRSCNPRESKLVAASRTAKQSPNRSLHLFVEGRYNKVYWMHLAAPVEVPLSRVDAFLRQVWLECCGHLSAFTIAGQRYTSQAMKDLGDSGMSARLSRLLQPGMAFSYEYDYGSTTELNLKVIGLTDQGMKPRTVELLARNEAPQVACQRCGSQPATQICTECEWKDQGRLCKTCAADHECGNSPRAGVCGYTG